MKSEFYLICYILFNNLIFLTNQQKTEKLKTYKELKDEDYVNKVILYFSILQE